MVAVDFKARVDPPLVKKFSVMNAGLIPMERYRRDLAKIATLRPDTLRIDLSIGKDVGWKKQFIEGTPAALTYNWEEIDELSAAVNRFGVVPYWSFCYQSKPLQINGSWRSPPNDYAAFEEAARAFSAHFLQRGIRIGYYEVWNEPDFGEFFSGTRDEYFKLYQFGARGLRAGDPNAPVGGPALAFSLGWVEPFLDFVQTRALPLDFFSYHSVTPPPDAPSTRQSALERLAHIRRALNARPHFAATEIHLGEYHPYKITPRGLEKPSDAPELATNLLDDFEIFLRETDLTQVQWAQFMDAAGGGAQWDLGLVGGDGKTRPAHAAFAAYNDLPIERVRIAAPAWCGGLAAANERQAGVLLWNRSDTAQQVTVSPANLPFRSARFTEFRVNGQAVSTPVAKTPGTATLDASISSLTAAGLTLRHSEPKLLTKTSSWQGTIEPHGIVYLRWENDAPAPRIAPPPGEVVRLHHFFAQRGSSQYAYFDRRTWSAHLSAGQQRDGLALIGLATRKLQAAIPMRFVVSGAPPENKALSARSAVTLGLRVDYRVGGKYVHSIFIHDGRLSGAANVPAVWGTRRAPERIVRVKDLSRFVFRPAAYAPPGWDSGAIFSFVLHHAAPGTRLDVYLRP